MSKGVQIEIDKASLNHLKKQFKALDTTIEKASPKAIFAVLTKIQSEAKLRLKGRRHIVTGRLWNSVHVKMRKFKNTPTNPETYQDDKGNAYKADLSTVNLKDNFEGAVGTNVEYSGFVEFKDSYLYWALNNVDITQEVKDDINDEMKFRL